MSVEVVGAGFGRTGTLSLKFALEKLGYDKCYHMMEVQYHPEHVAIWRDAGRGAEPDWHTLFAGYRATVDWPSCNFWREQLTAFPEARVILSRRDAESWYQSVINTIWASSQANARSDDPRVRTGSRMAYELIWDGIFEGRMDDKAFVIEKYEAHNQAVIDAVPAERLLVYEPGDGWDPLCAFLDCPVPDEDYPRVNTTAEFQERWRAISAAANDKNKSQ